MTPAPRYLLDTDICVYYLNDRYPTLSDRIDRIPLHQLSISSITVAELYFGAFNSKRIEANCRLVEGFLSRLPILDLDPSTGRIFGKIKAQLRRQGTPVADSDLLIAATALAKDLILVSNNERHFQRIQNLSLENWKTAAEA